MFANLLQQGQKMGLIRGNMLSVFILIASILLSGCAVEPGFNSIAPTMQFEVVTTAVSVDAPSPTPVGVTLEPASTYTPTPIGVTLEPASTYTPTPLPPTSAILQIPCDAAKFIADISVPDGMNFEPGTSFTKVWRLQNTGSCTWDTNYSLAFSGEEKMGYSTEIKLPHDVRPGERVDISINLVAPIIPGHYRGYWMLRNSSGKLFGCGEFANKALFVDITSVSETITSKPILTWEFYDGLLCETAIFSMEDLAYGECNTVLNKIPSQNSGHLPRLLELVSAYAPFTAQTSDAGIIKLNGTGNKIATWAEERAIAEWAQLNFKIAQAGRAGAAWGLAFSWHREGGIAGFCDDVAVYVTGLTTISNCAGINRQIYLNASQLEQLYSWVDTIKNIDYSYTDPDITDAMTITLVLSGNGQKQATPADIQAISDFASSLIGAVQK